MRRSIRGAGHHNWLADRTSPAPALPSRARDGSGSPVDIIRPAGADIRPAHHDIGRAGDDIDRSRTTLLLPVMPIL